jgi:hypothetical protein
MATVTFRFEPLCRSGFCDSPVTFCISLYRGPRSGTAAKTYYECFTGNVGLTGEQIAHMVLASVKSRTGIEGRLTSTDTEDNSSVVGSIAFDDIDEWDQTSTAKYFHVTCSPGEGFKPHPGKPGKPPERWRNANGVERGLAGQSGAGSIVETIVRAPWGATALDSLTTADDLTGPGSGPGYFWLRFDKGHSPPGRGLVLLTLKRDSKGEFIPISVEALVSDGVSEVSLARELAIRLSNVGQPASSVRGELQVPVDGGAAGSLVVEYVRLESTGWSPHIVGGFTPFASAGLAGPAGHARTPRDSSVTRQQAPARPAMRDREPGASLSAPVVSLRPGSATRPTLRASVKEGIIACPCGPDCSGGCHA